MRKSWTRFVFAALGGALLATQASAQSVSFWYNNLGDATGNKPSVINVVTGQDATLSVYMTTSGVGAFDEVQSFFGYSTTNTSGAAAVAADTNATFASLTWAAADLGSGSVNPGTGGGGPTTQTGSRPWGYFVTSLQLVGNFAESAEGANLHLYDIKLHVNAAAGTNIPINLWSVANPTNDFYVSGVQYNGGANEAFPSSPYTGTLHVVAVPEPASLAILGVGFAALLRRRRRA